MRQGARWEIDTRRSPCHAGWCEATLGTGPLLSADVRSAFRQQQHCAGGSGQQRGEPLHGPSALFVSVDVLKTGAAAAAAWDDGGSVGGAPPPPCVECFDLQTGRALPFRLLPGSSGCGTIR